MAKILIVDDSKDILELLSHLLQNRKYEVRSASSKLDILNCIDLFMPDLILLDVKLGAENGRLICREIKSKKDLRHIVIILISGHADVLKDYRDCGADDAVEKPFEIQPLVNKINRHLHERVYIS